MCENVNEKLEITIHDCEAIIEQIRNILLIDENQPEYNFGELNRQLNNIFHYVTCYPSDELVVWLSYTFIWKHRLPTWKPLLRVAYWQAQTRNEQVRVDRLFKGLTKYLEEDNDKTNDR